MEIIKEASDAWVDELLVLTPLDQAGIFMSTFASMVVQQPLVDFDTSINSFKESVGESKEEYDILAGTLLRIASFVDTTQLKKALDGILSEIRQDRFFGSLELPEFKAGDAILFILRLNFPQIVLRVSMNGKDPSIKKTRGVK